MRKTFKLLVAALSLVFCASLQSCQNTEQIPHGYPILFRCADITRAEATLDDLKENGFDVYAYFTGNGNTFTFTKSLSFNDANGWIYNGDIEYWLPGATYYFKAVYPNGVGTIDNTTSAQSFTISNFDVTSQTDLLVAQTGAIDVDASLGSPIGGSIVNLQFKHLLANVVVKIKAEVNVTINDMAIKFVPVNCAYENGFWTANSQGNIEKTNINTPLSTGADPAEIGFLVIPQTVNGEQKLHIKTSDKTYDIAIPATTWNAGTKYTYTLTIKQNDILFDEPSVEVWDEENATGSVVIK